MLVQKTSTTLSNWTGLFDVSKIDRNLFPGNFSNIEQFIREIETRCNFEKLKKIYIINIITLIIFIVLTIVSTFLIIFYAEKGHYFNWASWVACVSSFVMIILVSLNLRYISNPTWSSRRIFSNNSRNNWKLS